MADDELEKLYADTIEISLPKLRGEIAVRGISFIGGHEEPRLSLITEDGYAYAVLTESQVALLVEDGAAWLRKRIQQRSSGG